MTTDAQNERFIAELTAAQPRLYAYILSLVGNHTHADEILQETNLVLWRKLDEFDAETNFAAWACRVARYETLAFWRDASRETTFFSSELVEQLAADLTERQSGFDQRRGALRRCLESLSPKSRQLISQRYAEGLSVQAIADALSRTADSVATTLYRIRIALRDCIRAQERLQ